jgi:hypothetical protein
VTALQTTHIQSMSGDLPRLSSRKAAATQIQLPKMVSSRGTKPFDSRCSNTELESMTTTGDFERPANEQIGSALNVCYHRVIS